MRLNNRCPLVLDLGCGFGAAALGLADEFAVLGVDASAHCIGYAKAECSGSLLTLMSLTHSGHLEGIQSSSNMFKLSLE